MIESLRNLKIRIRSVKNTQKITRAMEMVSASKLNRTRTALFLERSYFTALEYMMMRILASADTASNPFFEKREGGDKIALCIITSDAGLCSIYNHAMIRFAEDFINKTGKDNVALIAIGREGFNYFRKQNFPIAKRYPELYGRYSDLVSQSLYRDFTAMFLKGDVNEVFMAYTHFSSTLRLKPVVEKLLNIECPKKEEKRYIIEPDMDALMEKMAPAYLLARIRLILLDAFTSEHASRMIAMKMATDNARDLMDSLALQHNKARQAAITKDILEIAMSAEALKGQ